MDNAIYFLSSIYGMRDNEEASQTRQAPFTFHAQGFHGRGSRDKSTD